jgi:hypothetical protein
MTRNDEIDTDPVTACVKTIGDLEQELQTAMSAIGCNMLKDFEESLWRQEMLCARLKRSISRLRLDPLKDEAARCLHESAVRLQAKSRSYEKLVARSSRSAAVLQHLCALYRNEAQHPGRAIHGCISREA